MHLWLSRSLSLSSCVLLLTNLAQCGLFSGYADVKIELCCHLV